VPSSGHRRGFRRPRRFAGRHGRSSLPAEPGRRTVRRSGSWPRPLASRTRARSSAEPAREGPADARSGAESGQFRGVPGTPPRLPPRGAAVHRRTVPHLKRLGEARRRDSGSVAR
jgi:hypothetical protein